jgi:Fe2+ or Zn2+ uptake regulation protein
MLHGRAVFRTSYAGLGCVQPGSGITVARLLLRDANRRVTAEILYDEAREAGCPVSRAAVCSALRQFEQAGLLRRVTSNQSKKSWFVVANASVGLN